MRLRTFAPSQRQTNTWISAARMGIFGPALLTLCALFLWMTAVKDINVGLMNDLGLVSVLPPMSFIALFLITVSFCLTLRYRDLRPAVVLPHVFVLIFMLYGITTLVEPVPRFHVAWRHVGISEYITRTGTVNPRINAYFNWPGFFILTAFLANISGFENAIPFLPWASVYFNLLYLGPLIMILRAATPDKRAVWLGVWFYYLTNWIGQDYYSQQALNYFFYLVVLAILLTWFKSTTGLRPFVDRWLRLGIFSRWRATGSLLPGASALTLKLSLPWQRVGLMAVLITIFAAAVPSHQITPIAAFLTVTVLVVFNRVTPRGLPIIMGLILALWIGFMATAYLSGNLLRLLQDVGAVSDNVGSNVVQRLRGSPEHILVVRLRLVMTVAIAAVGVLGAIRRLRRGYRDLTLALFGATPFALVVLQPYGGEMLLRAYLFALPAMAFFAAVFFYPSPFRGKTWITTAAVGGTSLLLLAGFLFTRYGNERMDYYTTGELDAVRYLYSRAEPGALLVAGSENMPWKYQDLEKYRYEFVSREIRTGDIRGIEQVMKSRKNKQSYLILTRSQKAYAELSLGLPPGAWEQLERTLQASGAFQLVYANANAKIFILARNN